jgi:hypothetical protein
MQSITTIEGLKNAIQILEVKQVVQGQKLREHFYLTYESLKPINLWKNALKEIFTSPDLMESIPGSTMGLVSGVLIKKIFIGKSENMFRKLIGSILQFGITNIFAQNSDYIKSIGQVISKHYSSKMK